MQSDAVGRESELREANAPCLQRLLIEDVPGLLIGIELCGAYNWMRNLHVLCAFITNTLVSSPSGDCIGCHVAGDPRWISSSQSMSVN